MTHQLSLSAEGKALRAEGVTSLFAGCISYSVHYGELYFRALLSEDIKFGETDMMPKWKFPGGMLENLESVDEAFFREWCHEAIRPNSRVSLDSTDTIDVLTIDKPDHDVPGGKHRQIFRMFNERYLKNYKGDMHFRASPTMEPPDGKNPGGILYVAQPIRVPTLCRLMKASRVWAHRRALVMAVRRIAQNSMELFRTIPRDFCDWVQTDEYMDTVKPTRY